MSSPLTFLAGDLGGTKTLLAIYRWDGELKKICQQRYLSTEWQSLEPMICHFFNQIPKGVIPPSHSCIAVAGPVFNGSAQITNLNWNLSEEKICNHIGLEKLELVNDFCALIYGLPFLKDNQHVEIQPLQEKKPKEGVIAILGAGTGLGIARGHITTHGIEVLPSEGGHREFAPRTEKEWELAEWLKTNLQLERLSLERIVSGTGLGHVANWRLQQADTNCHPLQEVANAWRYKTSGKPDLPAMVSKAAKDGDPVMNEALEIWLGAYGSAAGDLALHELCTAGLWIGGGTAQKHLHGLRSQNFLNAMRNKGRFKEFLEKLPVMALIDPQAGLFGAACRAHMLADSNWTLS